MNKTLYNNILDMDIDAKNVPQVFHKEDERVATVCARIIDLAQEEHDQECKIKGVQCPGTIPYIIKHLKIHLTSHQEYEDMFVLAILISTFKHIGIRETESKQQVEDKLKQAFKGPKLPAILQQLKDLAEKEGAEVEIHQIDLEEDDRDD